MRPALLLAILLVATATARASPPVVIRHVPAQRATIGEELPLKATILAPAGVFLPKLYFRLAGEEHYRSVELVAMGGDVFGTAIAGFFVLGDLEYYLEAYDKDGHGPFFAAAPTHPFRVPAWAKAAERPKVTVKTTPSGASLRIDGQAFGLAPLQLPLDVGTHVVLASLAGFQPVEESFDVALGRDLALDLTLAKATARSSPASLAVVSTPTGAQVSVDGKLLGATPWIGEAPVGRHEIGLELPGYLRQRRTVTFLGDRDMQLSVDLVPLPPGPALAVTSDPPGAQLFIDGNPVGKTPYIGVAAKGDHELSLQLTGRRPLTSDVVMPPDRDLDLRFSLPEESTPIAPALAVESEPAGAAVFLDDRPLGMTPLIAPATAGRHEVRLSAVGFEPYRRTVLVQPGRDTELAFALVRQSAPAGPAALTVASTPSAAAVTIDGDPAGTAPYSTRLAPGEHRLRLSLAGHRTVEEVLHLVAGQARELSIALPPVEGPPRRLLTVATEPAGANVTVDGQSWGASPDSKEVAAGAHELVARRPGYRDRVEKFVVPDEREFELKLSLELVPLRREVSFAPSAPVALAPAPRPPSMHQAPHAAPVAPPPSRLPTVAFAASGVLFAAAAVEAVRTSLEYVDLTNRTFVDLPPATAAVQQWRTEGTVSAGLGVAALASALAGLALLPSAPARVAIAPLPGGALVSVRLDANLPR